MIGSDYTTNVFSLVCFGFLLLATIYHLILCVHFRDRLIFNYVAYLVFSGLFVWLRGEMPADMLGTATANRLYRYFDEGLQITGFTLYINFGINALGLQNIANKTYYKIWLVLSWIMISYAIAVTVLKFFGVSVPSFFFLAIRIVIFGVSMILLRRLIAIKKSRFQDLILYGCIYFFLTTFMSFLANTRENITIIFSSLEWLYIGYMGDIVFFSIAIGFWVKSIFDEKQAAVLEAQQARADERNRISMDIHDDLGSGLTKIAILGEIAKTQLGEPDKAKAHLESIANYSRELVDNLQHIIWVLNAENDTLSAFAAYLREYAVNFFDNGHIRLECQFVIADEHLRLSETQRRNLFLVVKESCNNILKHAKCDEVAISLGQAGQGLNIRIRDNGKGFDPGSTRAYGNGLKNMSDRLGQVGGSCAIETEIGKGTEVIFHVPLFWDMHQMGKN